MSEGSRASQGRRTSGGTVVRRAVGVLGELLITLGVLVLLFVVWQLWWTDVVAGREQARQVTSLEQQWEHPSRPGAAASPDGSTVTTGPSATAPRPTQRPDRPTVDDDPLVSFTGIPKGQAFAIIRVPRFGDDYARPILQGSGTEELKHGVGHYVGTAMPGQVGNFAIAGHRTTYGRPFHDIDKLRPGDAIIVETKRDYYVYRMRRHTIVRPWQTEVIAPVPEHPGEQPRARWLTMTSCHPKYYATYRWIAFAKFDRTIPRSQGLPPALLEVQN